MCIHVITENKRKVLTSSQVSFILKFFFKSTHSQGLSSAVGSTTEMFKVDGCISFGMCYRRDNVNLLSIYAITVPSYLYNYQLF